MDKLSSAHVYVRQSADKTVYDIPESVVRECSQLVKENSIEGKELQQIDKYKSMKNIELRNKSTCAVIIVLTRDFQNSATRCSIVFIPYGHHTMCSGCIA